MSHLGIVSRGVVDELLWMLAALSEVENAALAEVVADVAHDKLNEPVWLEEIIVVQLLKQSRDRIDELNCDVEQLRGRVVQSDDRSQGHEQVDVLLEVIGHQRGRCKELGRALRVADVSELFGGIGLVGHLLDELDLSWNVMSAHGFPVKLPILTLCVVVPKMSV